MSNFRIRACRLLWLLPLLLVGACLPRSSGSSVPAAEDRAPLSPAVALLLENAWGQIGVTRYYDPAYVPLEYPGGDLPADRGVCTDVVIRAFRAAGVDLQREVHEEMQADFDAFPKLWGLSRPDPNIDHRRVPNLRVLFERRGKSLPVTLAPEDYLPGDVVTWLLNSRGQTHIGLVSDRRDPESGRFLIIHNIGRGAEAEDILFNWRITGHYRWF